MSVSEQEPVKIIVTSRILTEIERRLGCAIEFSCESPIALLKVMRAYIERYLQGIQKQGVVDRLAHIELNGGQLDVYVQLPVGEQLIVDGDVLGYNSEPVYRTSLIIPPTS